MTHNSLNKSYTQMCIWVDNNAYKEDVDIDVLFKHLYHIVRCMSLVFHLFKSENDLEDFSTEFAENLLLRYLNPNLSKLKSISNYIHKTIFGVSASFLKKQFSQIVEWDKDSVYSNDIIIASTSSIDRADTSWCLTHFPMLIKNCINKTPFNEIVSKNLYISVMLSIIVSIENKEECIILYHLENFEKQKKLNRDNNYVNNGTYNKFKSESLSKLSSSHEPNSNSHSKEKQHIKTLTEFDNIPNYYESLINELEHQRKKGQKVNVNSAIEYDNNILENFAIKKKLENINIGIPYKIYNGYKFYFNLPNEQIYILKEVSYSCGKGLIPQIELWNKKYLNDSIYLKIYDHEINFNQRQIIWIMQYPTGGESINDIINSVGFYDQNYLFDLVTKIYKSIIKLKEDKECEKYRNVPFCICDIFINVNEHIKIIPPLIRKIPIDSNLDKKNNNNHKQLKHMKQCKCKDNLKQILYSFDKDSYSFFCLGFVIIQTITQNLIFDISSYIYILNLLKKSKKTFLKEHCCFVHLLLNIEKQHFNNSKYLLFSHFLNLYPKSLLSLLHECTNFESNIPSSSNEFLNLYDTNKNLNLSIKEVLDITTIPENKYTKFDTFLSDFEILFKDIKINPEIYLHKLNSNKVIHVLSRAFGVDKEFFKNKIKEKIRILKDNKNKTKFNNSENDYLNEENGNNYNFKNDNISSLFIGYNKNRNEMNENMFNKQNNSNLKHNYIHSSENYEYK